MNLTKNITSIDQYIEQFPANTQQILNKIRTMIQHLVPEAKEKMSYGIPTFTLNGNLIHFGAYPKHIGLYPGAQPISDPKDKLKGYKTSKGTVQFPLDKPIPYKLIEDIALLCAEINKKKKTNEQ